MIHTQYNVNTVHCTLCTHTHDTEWTSEKGNDKLCKTVHRTSCQIIAHIKKNAFLFFLYSLMESASCQRTHNIYIFRVDHFAWMLKTHFVSSVICLHEPYTHLYIHNIVHSLELNGKHRNTFITLNVVQKCVSLCKAEQKKQENTKRVLMKRWRANSNYNFPPFSI